MAYLYAREDEAIKKQNNKWELPLSQAIAVCMGLWQPLFIKNGYLDIVSAKLAFVLVLSLWGAVCLLVRGLSRRGRSELCAPGPASGWVLAFAAGYTLSAVISEYPGVWLGLKNRYNGAVLYLCLALLYLVVRTLSGAQLRSVAAGSMQAAAVAAGAVTLLNYCGIDVLQAMQSVTPGLDYVMTSTFGNVNFAAAFYLMPVCLAFRQLQAAQTLRSRENLLPAGCWCIGAAALVCCGSDGAVLGFTAAMLVEACTAALTKKWFARCGWLATAGLAAIACTGAAGELSGSAYRRDSICGWLLQPAHAAMLLVPCAAALVYVHRRSFAWAACLPLSKRTAAMRHAVLAGGLVCAALLLAANLLPGVLPEAASSNLTFTDSWGGGRGYVWGLTPQLFAGFSPLQKLFGAGPDSVVYLLNPAFTEAIAAINGATFDSMHNEYLQYLLCGGVFGLIAWCGLLGSHFVAAMRCKNGEGRGFAMALTAYAVQAFFNIATPAATPALFLVLACCPPCRKAAPQELSFTRVLAVCLLAGLFIWPQAAWLAS